jgi:hypothetical protein
MQKNKQTYIEGIKRIVKNINRNKSKQILGSVYTEKNDALLGLLLFDNLV